VTKIYKKSKRWVNNFFPMSAIAVYFAYFLKPWVIKIILKIRGMKDKMSFYSGEIFFMRFTYDFFFILTVTFIKYDSEDLSFWKMLGLMSPVLIGQPILYIFTVVPNKKINKKIRFRMVKTRVTTDEENMMMYSTDDEIEVGLSVSD
jgi:hypothetical protein